MKRIYLLLITVFCGICAHAQMTTRTVRDSLFIPWELVYGPDNHVWFTQKNGYVCKLDPGTKKIDTLIHETAVEVQGEGGMLGLAIHPDFPAQPYVYVAYDYLQGSNYRERIVRYTYNSTNTTLSSSLILLDNINAAVNHNGCRLLIVNDKLYITTGDAANPNTAQDVTALNGKVLRLNLDGTIPSDNPIPENPVWSWGHRNAQGMVFAKNTLYATEHGVTTDDELNIIEKGRNYGWPAVEGFCSTASEMAFCADSNVKQPIYTWSPAIAVCGLDYYDYTLPMLPVFHGSLIMTTLKDSVLYELEMSQGNTDSITSIVPFFGNQFGRLRDVCISPQGSIFLSTSNSTNGGTPVDKIIEIYDPAYTHVPDLNKNTGIAVYPNPAGDYAIIRIVAGSENNSGYSYILTATDGKIVDRGKLRSNNAKLNTAGLIPGIYQLKITDDNGRVYNSSIQKQ